MTRMILVIAAVLFLSGCAGGPEEREPVKEKENPIVSKYVERVEKDYQDHLAKAGELETKRDRLTRVLEELEKENFDEETISRLLLRDTTYDREIEELRLKKDRIERMIRETEKADAELDEKWKKYDAEYDRLIKKYEELGKLLEKTARAMEEEALREGK
ncbi:MAG: hypothetical protein ACYS47_04390 [Planctomycetota bacterium]|jgi:hypothetical protein